MYNADQTSRCLTSGLVHIVQRLCRSVLGNTKKLIEFGGVRSSSWVKSIINP